MTTRLEDGAIRPRTTTPRRATTRGRTIPPVPVAPRSSTYTRAQDPAIVARMSGLQGAHLAGGSRTGMGPVDDGVDPLQHLLQGTPPTGGGGGGGGGSPRGGSGGGGGGGGVSKASADAFRALLASYGQGAGSEYDAYEANMRAAYDPSKVNAIFDQQGAGIRSAADAGRGRLAPIMQGLDSRAATARTGVNQAMSDTDLRLKALQAEYQAQAASTNQGLNASMEAFGAGPVQDTGAQSLQNLFANSRVANTRAQGVMDAGMADRPAVYGGLEADVLSGISRDQGGLESRVAQQRAAGLQQNDAALQQLLGQTGVARIQAQQAAKQDQLKLQAQLAEMGITL